MPANPRLSISLYTDEDVTDRLAELLQERGFSAANVAQEGTGRLNDENQLVYATARGWTLLTYNRDDFLRLPSQWYREGRDHPGILISQHFSRRETGELLRQVLNLLGQVTAEEMRSTVRYLQSYR